MLVKSEELFEVDTDIDRDISDSGRFEENWCKLSELTLILTTNCPSSPASTMLDSSTWL